MHLRKMRQPNVESMPINSIATLMHSITSHPASRRSPPRKLLQIGPRSYPQHKPPPLIRHHRELLLPILAVLAAVKEHLEFLQRRIHRDDFIHPPLPPELNHRLADLVTLFHLPVLEKDPQVWDREVAQESAVRAGDDGEVGVVSFEGREQRVGDGVRGVAREGGGRVEVFYRRLLLLSAN